jgi:hypothetical protein
LSLIETLIKPVQSYCLKGNLIKTKMHSNKVELVLDSALNIQAKQVILTAGAGNAGLLSILGLNQPQQQLRPLQMLMLKGDLPALYGHCLGASTTPKATITSAKSGDQQVWYLGGQIAESGVGLTADIQIQKAKKLLNQVIPWVNIQACQWQTLNIDRAEPAISNGARPADAFVEKTGRIITTWPTKLALTPRLYDKVLALLDLQDSFNINPNYSLPKAPIAEAPWALIK